MSLRSSIAGPSRLPYRGLQAVRGYAADASAPRDGDQPQSRGPPTQMSFPEWKIAYGSQYRQAKPGSKARWLGNKVPFPNNPSFRPPPPLSNTLQDLIWAELRSGERTVGQLSVKYGVSRARIEAIRKLKEVEAEFRRQGLQLQNAYQRGMEDLLGVKAPVGRNGEVTAAARRAEEEQRVASESNRAEMEEEGMRDSHEGFIGGAFGDLRLEAGLSGLEKDSWEFVSEEQLIADKQAKEEAKGKPEEVVVKKAAAKVAPLPEVVARTSKSVFRFIDTSHKN